jgi:hypothetical protein
MEGRKIVRFRTKWGEITNMFYSAHRLVINTIKMDYQTDSKEREMRRYQA